MSIAGSLSHSQAAIQFKAEQMRRDTVATVKEAGLGARTGRKESKDPKVPSPKRSHCDEAHKSLHCWKTCTEKMPQWMKVKQEEQHNAREAKGAAAKQLRKNPTPATRILSISPASPCKTQQSDDYGYLTLRRGSRRVDDNYTSSNKQSHNMYKYATNIIRTS
ncbi:hypothetical protein FRC04_003789 [Tulasnella sp. 424]|nr:hypothetical protein FRC04_003789 [Tulasnella sp. 424]